MLLHNHDTLGNIKAVSLKEIPCVCKVSDWCCRQRRAETTPRYFLLAGRHWLGAGKLPLLHFSRHLLWMPRKLPEGWPKQALQGTLVWKHCRPAQVLLESGWFTSPQTGEKIKRGNVAKQKKIPLISAYVCLTIWPPACPAQTGKMRIRS